MASDAESCSAEDDASAEAPVVDPVLRQGSQYSTESAPCVRSDTRATDASCTGLAPEAVRQAVAAVAAEIRRDGYLGGVTLLGKADNREVLAGLDLPTFAAGASPAYMPGYQNTDLPDAVRPEYMPPPTVPRAPYAEP